MGKRVPNIRFDGSRRRRRLQLRVVIASLAVGACLAGSAIIWHSRPAWSMAAGTGYAGPSVPIEFPAYCAEPADPFKESWWPAGMRAARWVGSLPRLATRTARALKRTAMQIVSEETSPRAIAVDVEDLRYAHLTEDRLKDRFARLAVQAAEIVGDPTYDPVAWDLEAVLHEFNRRNARHLLAQFYAHEDVRVRWEAAFANLQVDTLTALSRLQVIDDAAWTPAWVTVGLPRGAMAFASVDSLVERFAEAAMEYDEAEIWLQGRRLNRSYYLLHGLLSELTMRPGDQRRALIALYLHANPQVRLEAALATIDIAPFCASRTLQRIIDFGEEPQLAEARDTLIWMESRREAKKVSG